MTFDVAALPTPCYVIDLARLERNLALLAQVGARAEARILLALKGFAAWGVFPLVRRYLAGTAASSLHEARLGREACGGEVHIYAPAYRDDQIDAILELCDHIIFNSFSQWQRFGARALAAGLRCGLRINPRHSEVKVPMYDPCAPGSRLGIPRACFAGQSLDGITGLHFHNLCELNADALERTLRAVEHGFADILPRMQWVNFGGGHHITREDYDTELLVGLVRAFRARYGVEVILEPGEAIALNAGFLVSTVLDVIAHDDRPVAILDTSASAHMPDVIEMPYRPRIIGAGEPDAKTYTYTLGGMTCLAGDVIGAYSFDAPLAPGDRLVFCDMAIYTMVKNTTFNGIGLPAIVFHDPAGATRVVKTFGYEDYKGRLS